MQNLDFKIGFGRKKLRDGEEPRLMRHHTWVAVAVGGSALLGGGISYLGARKQEKANQSAQDQNAQLQREQNDSGWQSYLMQRGLNPMGATAGNLPSITQAINTRLPLWANVRKTGSGGYSLARSLPSLGAPAAAGGGGAGAGGGNRSWQLLGINR